MRVKNVRKTRKSLHDAAEEFISVKTAQKVRERTVREYRKYLDDFVQKSSDSLGMDELKRDLLRYFAAVQDTSSGHHLPVINKDNKWPSYMK